MKSIIQYFSQQIHEIQDASVLRIYGLFLSLTHVLSAYFWKTGFSLSEIYGNGTSICWTFIPHCEVVQASLVHRIDFLLYALGALGILGSLLFLKKSWTVGAYIVFVLATLLKLFIFFLDYRMMGNYHYMANISVLVFLFLPQKLWLSQIFIVCYYVAAGLIKFNADWVSGQALLRPAIFTGDFLVFSLVYVIFLELFISWFLLSKNKWLFWGALVQFILFHAFSWHIVGYFYPCVMACIISIFILNRVFNKQESRPLPLKTAGKVALALFAIAQLVPLVFYPNSAVTGKGRLLSLNMLDGRSNCLNHVFVTTQQEKYLTQIRPRIGGIRIRCDPLVYYYEAQRLCKELRAEDPTAELDIAVYSGRSSLNDYVEVWSAKKFCSEPKGIGVLEGPL